MTTTSDPSPRCPVCDGNVEHGRSRCGRCESDLDMWWPLEEAIRRVGEPLVSVAQDRPVSLPRLARHGRMVVVAILCAAAGASAAYWATTREPAGAGVEARVDAARQKPLSGTEGPPTHVLTRVTPTRFDVVYYVQRGDTWWALGRRFTGHGRNWPALEEATNHVPLRSGSILRFDSAKLAGFSTEGRWITDAHLKTGAPESIGSRSQR
jgi:hypothetical protein